MGLTKQVLRRPVTTVLVVLCLIVFGLSSVFSSKLELTPEMEMPMLVVNAVYPGASPEDVEELVTKPIEDEISTLTGRYHHQHVFRKYGDGAFTVRVWQGYG